MNGIKDYLISLIGACIIGALADLVTSSFSERHPGLDKSVRLGITVCVLAAVLLPILGGASDNDYFQGVLPYKKAELIEYDRAIFLEQEVCEATKKYIFEKTGINITDIAINIEVKDDASVEISGAEITVSGSLSEYDEKISAAAFEALGREAVIVYVD